jgi:PST family polysaccharide transporter
MPNLEETAGTQSSEKLMLESDRNLVEHSYGRIMKSTFVMGASSVINILLGIVRNKILALILGPSGMGLTGIYQSVTSMIGSVSGMGIRESGVRQIAVALRTDDQAKISRTILTLRRTALLSGVAGFLLLFILSKRISILTFGNSSHSTDLAILSVTIFFGGVSAGQVALIQGMQRIKDLAKLGMLGAFFGTVFSIPIIYLYKERGIAFYLFIVSAMTIITSWWYSRKIRVISLAQSWRESLLEAKPLLRLGTALMLGSLMSAGTPYLIRVILVRTFSLDAAGIFQASSLLSTVYVGILLNAMITDYYPSLSAASRNNFECTSLINRQVEVGMLFAAPGVLATLTFAPLAIQLFYSSKFIVAIGILRWQIVGVFLQVITWPMGFIFRAKGHGKLFVRTEIFHNAIYLSLTWIGTKYFGLPGIGMAFLGMNLCYLVLVYCIVRGKYEFSFSSINFRIFLIFGIALIIVFLSPLILPRTHLFVDLAITLSTCFFSIKKLINTGGAERILSLLSNLRSRFRY